MTTVTALFGLIVLLVLGSVTLSLSALVRRERAAGRLGLALLLVSLAVAVWVVGIQNPLPLP